MKCNSDTMLLYAVTDRMWEKNQTLFEQVEAALKGGATCIQLREKELDDSLFLKEAIKMRELCKRYKVPLIINDNVDVAIKCKADGIHVGQDDMNVNYVRSLVGENMIIGVSAHTVKQAIQAQNEGADYLGVGAMFNTSTKSDAKEITYKTLQEICGVTTIPVVAIGGINKTNIMQLSGSGVDGVALVSAIFAANDIEKECKELRLLVQEMIRA